MGEWQGWPLGSRGWPRCCSGGRWGSMRCHGLPVAAEDEPGAGHRQEGGPRHVSMSPGVKTSHNTLL